jgi:peptidoglycan/xylan/chitin deacetylase (PgdA/CDA1 family)
MPIGSAAGFPTNHIPYRDRPGLSVWPNGARMAMMFYSCAEEWLWDVPEHPLDPFPLARFGEKNLSLSTRTAIGYGFDVGLYRIADILNDLGMKSTFLTNAISIEQHPETVQMLHDEGHELCGHAHSEGMTMTAIDHGARVEAVKAGVDALTELTGEKPKTWLSPAASADRDTIELVAEAGFIGHCDLQDDELPYFIHVNGKTMVEIPYRMAGNVNDVPITTIYGAVKSVGDTTRHLIEAFDAYYEAAETHPLLFNFGTHPHVIGRPDNAKALRSFLSYVKERDDVWTPTYAEVAEWWSEQYGHLADEAGGDLNIAAVRS